MTSSANVDSSSRYRDEAGQFLSVMGEVASELCLDYSKESLQRLDQFISDNFEPVGSKAIADSLLQGIGCYLGEVIIRNLGGEWDESGKPEIVGLSTLPPIQPIEKAHQRFQNGRQDSLAWYYHSLAKKAYEMEAANNPPQNNEGGLFGFLSSLFKK
ncbi:MAG TPA: hypothetical protein V6C99_10925 [Oculatellaceae cyanobacterium]|jgi:hypothetical protein